LIPVIFFSIFRRKLRITKIESRKYFETKKKFEKFLPKIKIIRQLDFLSSSVTSKQGLIAKSIFWLIFFETFQAKVYQTFCLIFCSFSDIVLHLFKGQIFMLREIRWMAGQWYMIYGLKSNYEPFSGSIWDINITNLIVCNTDKKDLFFNQQK